MTNDQQYYSEIEQLEEELEQQESLIDECNSLVERMLLDNPPQWWAWLDNDKQWLKENDYE